MDQLERYSRQVDIIPKHRLDKCNVTIVGVGAIGRQVAMQLTAMGTNNIQFIDHDIVEMSNLASQGYLEGDLNKQKVDATAEICSKINNNLIVRKINGRFRRTAIIGNVLFCCVDKIDTRRHIWEAVKDKVDFFVDGRMSAEVLRVISASDAASREHYPSTLFSAGEAHAGSCTAKTTIYCANLAAAYMISRFTKWLRDIPSEKDIMLNLMSEELIVN